MAADLHDPPRPLRPGIAGRGPLRHRRRRFAPLRRGGGGIGGRRPLLFLLHLIGGEGLEPLRLHLLEPDGEIGIPLAVEAVDVDLVAFGRIGNQLPRLVVGEQRLHRPQHVDRLETAIGQTDQILLLGDRLLLLLLRLRKRRDRCRRAALRRISLAEGVGIELGRVGRPGEERSQEAQRRRAEEPDHRPDGPRLLRLNEPLADDLPGEEIRVDRRFPHPLEGEAVRCPERQPILLEGRRRGDVGPLEAAVGVEPLDLDVELLADEVGEPLELRGVAEEEDLADPRRPIRAGEVVERPLEFRGKLVEHRLHRIEHVLGVVRPGRIALQLLRLGEGQLQALNEGLGEVVAADRHAPLPDPQAVGDDEVGGVDAHRHEHHRRRRLEGIDRRRVGHLIEDQHVQQRHRRELEDVDLDAGFGERHEGLGHLLLLHREQSDLGVEDEASLLEPADEPLPVPFDLLEREGDLLPGLVPDDVGNLLGLDRRQLDELGEARLPRDRDRDAVPLELVAADELLERGADKLHRIGFRLGEDHRVFDVVERLGGDLARLGRIPATNGLEGTFADVDAPDVRTAGHGLFQREEREKRGGLAASAPPASLYERSRRGVKPVTIGSGLSRTAG